MRISKIIKNNPLPADAIKDSEINLSSLDVLDSIVVDAEVGECWARVQQICRNSASHNGAQYGRKFITRTQDPRVTIWRIQ